ncbi:MAG: hypothetical protein P4N59_16890 [Negativicutes bacterium]|nr:hypothetical protein [Negativicutes bacterium]
MPGQEKICKQRIINHWPELENIILSSAAGEESAEEAKEQVNQCEKAVLGRKGQTQSGPSCTANKN